MIAELTPEVAAGRQQRPQRGITPLMSHSLVIANDTPRLVRLDITTKASSGRNAYHAVKHHAILHQNICYTRGEQAAHGATL